MIFNLYKAFHSSYLKQITVLRETNRCVKCVALFVLSVSLPQICVFITHSLCLYYLLHHRS